MRHPIPLPDLVLIDDDSLIHMLWQMKAETNDQVCLCFFDEASFLKEGIQRHVPIYVDYSLGTEDGLHVTHNLISQGYTNVYLTTGFPIESHRLPQELRGLVGKEYPFEHPPSPLLMTAPEELNAYPPFSSAQENVNNILALLCHDIRSLVYATKTSIQLIEEGAAPKDFSVQAIQELTHRGNTIEKLLNTLLARLSGIRLPNLPPPPHSEPEKPEPLSLA